MADRRPDRASLHPFLQGDRPVAVAHRGGALEAPENTIEAFEYAAELGYRYIETDAQLTADGVVVAFHDSSIDRVSETSGEISDWRWSDLSSVAIEGSGRLTTIEQLLDAYPGHKFNIDAKSDAVADPLLGVIANASAFERVCVGSFDEKRLVQMRANAPDLCTSFGPPPTLKHVIRSLGIPIPRQKGGLVFQVPMAYRGLPIVTQRFIDRAHDDGLLVHVWTINDADQMRRLLDMGVDGVMTDRPSVLKDVFTERGLPF